MLSHSYFGGGEGDLFFSSRLNLSLFRSFCSGRSRESPFLSFLMRSGLIISTSGDPSSFFTRDSPSRLLRSSFDGFSVLPIISSHESRFLYCSYLFRSAKREREKLFKKPRMIMEMTAPHNGEGSDRCPKTAASAGCQRTEVKTQVSPTNDFRFLLVLLFGNDGNSHLRFRYGLSAQGKD